MQLASSALVLWLLGTCGRIDVDALDHKKLRAYWIVAAVFLLNIYTNIMALKHTTVETVIVFRSLTTVIVAFCDWHGPPLTAAVFATLVGIVVCCAGYGILRTYESARERGSEGGRQGKIDSVKRQKRVREREIIFERRAGEREEERENAGMYALLHAICFYKNLCVCVCVCMCV
jgi:hypothetical protein